MANVTAESCQAALDLLIADADDCLNPEERDLVLALRAILASGRCRRDELGEAPA